MSASPEAELSALSSTLDEMVGRVAALALRLDKGPTALAATDLFEVERALRTAARRMQRARRDLPRTV